jgi:ABC-type methionine transport system ATPase subunit
MALLAFREVGKRFPDGPHETVVMDRVSFEISEGETVGLHASRGRGKTTLLRLAAGIDLPDSGKVLWDDQDFTRMTNDQRARLRRRGAIALASGLWGALESRKVLHYLVMLQGASGIKSAEARACAIDALDMTQASHLMDRKVKTLGSRERIRVGLAQALANKPRMLLVDEPAFMRLPFDADEFYALLHSLHQRLGFTLLVASTEIAALRGCNQLMHLANGRLISTTSPPARRPSLRVIPGSRPSD